MKHRLGAGRDNMNDIDLKGSDCNLAISADDTTIIKANREGCCSIQHTIDYLKTFCARNLSFSEVNCESLSFGKRHPRKLRILDKLLSYKSAFKYLGVFVDRYLGFSEPIEHVVKKLEQMCGLSYKIRHMYPQNCL